MYNIAEDTGLGKGWERMIFNTGSALLDAIVLAVVSREPEGTYGYKITQEVRQAIDLSESTLYPVLRRLQKDGCLEVYDMEFGGRNRRYYRITEQGSAQLSLYEAGERCRPGDFKPAEMIVWRQSSGQVHPVSQTGIPSPPTSSEAHRGSLRLWRKYCAEARWHRDGCAREAF